MVGDGVAFNQCDKIPLCIATQCRNAEGRIGREEIFSVALQVRKVAASPPGHENLLADLIGGLQHHNTPAPLAGGDSAHQPGCTTAQYDHIGVFHSLDPSSHALDVVGIDLALPKNRKRVTITG